MSQRCQLLWCVYGLAAKFWEIRVNLPSLRLYEHHALDFLGLSHYTWRYPHSSMRRWATDLKRWSRYSTLPGSLCERYSSKDFRLKPSLPDWALLLNWLDEVDRHHTGGITCLKPLNEQEGEDEQKIWWTKTYNSQDSHVVTHHTTNWPACGLSTAERTGSPVLHTLWSYVRDECQRVTIFQVVYPMEIGHDWNFSSDPPERPIKSKTGSNRTRKRLAYFTPSAMTEIHCHFSRQLYSLIRSNEASVWIQKHHQLNAPEDWNASRRSPITKSVFSITDPGL